MHDGSEADSSRTHHLVLGICKDYCYHFDNFDSCLIPLFTILLLLTMAATLLGKSNQKLLS